MVILGTPGLKQKKRVSWSMLAVCDAPTRIIHVRYPFHCVQILRMTTSAGSTLNRHLHLRILSTERENTMNNEPYQSSRGSPILWAYLIVCPSSGWGSSARDRDSQGQTEEHAPSLIANFRCLWTLVTSITVRRLLRFLDVANLPDKRRSLGERATCALHFSVSAGYEPAHIEVADREVQLGTTRDARRCSTL